MNPYIREIKATNTTTGYYAEDSTDPYFFIEGAVTIQNGERVLTFIVLAERQGLSGTPIRGMVKGIEFFEAMWDYFVVVGTTIDVVQAEWTDRQLSTTATFATNLDLFNRAAHAYPNLEAAALHGTITGHYCLKKNLTRVNIVSLSPPVSTGQTGPFKDVIVQFRRP